MEGNSEVIKLAGRVMHRWHDILQCITKKKQGGSNMTGTDLYVNKPHCAAAVRP